MSHKKCPILKVSLKCRKKNLTKSVSRLLSHSNVSLNCIKMYHKMPHTQCLNQNVSITLIKSVYIKMSHSKYLTQMPNSKCLTQMSQKIFHSNCPTQNVSFKMSSSNCLTRIVLLKMSQKMFHSKCLIQNVPYILSRSQCLKNVPLKVSHSKCLTVPSEKIFLSRKILILPTVQYTESKIQRNSN